MSFEFAGEKIVLHFKAALNYKLIIWEATWMLCYSFRIPNLAILHTWSKAVKRMRKWNYSISVIQAVWKSWERNIIMDVTPCNLRRLMHSLKKTLKTQKEESSTLDQLLYKQIQFCTIKRFFIFHCNFLLHFQPSNEPFLCLQKLRISLGYQQSAILFIIYFVHFVYCQHF